MISNILFWFLLYDCGTAATPIGMLRYLVRRLKGLFGIIYATL